MYTYYQRGQRESNSYIPAPYILRPKESKRSKYKITNTNTDG